VFNINIIENKEKAKYSTKNNISDAAPDFLPLKNHKRANTISNRILILMAESRCKFWLPGSLSDPLENTNSDIAVITEKASVSIRISFSRRLIPVNERSRDPVIIIRVSSIKSLKMYLLRGFKTKIYFIKSFTAV